jgi:ketosteroid isomerase-like protein
MEDAYNKGRFRILAAYYANNGKVIGKNVEINGKEKLVVYWQSLVALGGTWKLTNEKTEKIGEQVWQKGISVITDKDGKTHSVNFTLVFVREDGLWKILQDAYW